ncbi:hypothetical protein [Lapillicoccus jejuensis]|uniref:Uncharacterized protein n=1 Tax=Lapillicoccus jejuensis TaxID=402171 RepID=A0A542E031_9MICO|nr:hypothetical protein [Lapillicoccus jejuensis]TQJ08688.1 hypothetical protein FB458_1780 [Lapillicoccus jejuensis]
MSGLVLTAPTPLRRRTDLLAPALALVVGLVAVLAGAPALVAGTVLLLGALAAADRLAALRRRGLLDRLLVAVGGLLVALVLLGLVLGSTPLELRPRPWALAVALAGVVALVVAATRPRPVGPRVGRLARTSVLRTVPWVAAGLLVVGAAVGVSLRSVEATSVAPLQFSLGPVQGTAVDVVVSTGSTSGPLEVRTALDGSDVSYPLVTPTPGHPVTVRVALPATGRYTITLNRPDQPQPLRTIILDR